MNRQNNVGGRIQPSGPPMMNTRTRGRGLPLVGRGGPPFVLGGRTLAGRHPPGRGLQIGRMPGRGSQPVLFPGDRPPSTNIGFNAGPRVTVVSHAQQGVRPGVPLHPPAPSSIHGKAVPPPPPPPPPPPRHLSIPNAKGRGGAPPFAPINARGPPILGRETNRPHINGRESNAYQPPGLQAQPPFPQINPQQHGVSNGVFPAPPPPQKNYMQPPTVFLNQTASRPITYTTLTTAGVPSDPRQQYSRDITPTAFSNVRPDPRSAPAAPTFASHQAVALGNATQPVQNVTYSQDHIDQAWIEYTPPNGGTKYYYNSITRSSQYEIPTSFKAKESHPKKTEKVSDSPVWKEYTDRTTGKKYFSDGKTTTWDRPACMETTEERKSKEESPGPPRKKKKQAKHDFEFGNKEEAVAAFKGLLLAKEILPSMKWNDVIKLCSSDHRWDACEAVLTTGERKQAMAEYQTKRANELKTIEREEKIRAKEAFLQMLSNTLSSSPSFSCWTSRFGDVRDLLAKDDRFHAVATEGERESLFLDFCEDFKKREERRKKEQKNEIKSAFHGFLMEKEEQGSLTFSSTWKSFLSTLTDEEKSDPRFIVSNLMNHSDRQLYFADYVIELQAEEDDKRNRIRGARRRAEKAQREALEDALHQLARDGKILPSSTWRSVEDIITSLPSYGPVNDQDREAPREMFESFVVDWSETYKRDRMVLSQIFSSASKNQFVITPNTSYEEFTKALLEAASDTSDLHALARRIINRSEPLSSARMYLKELILEAKGISGAVIARAIRRRSGHDSSEDEGEIVEEDAIELV